MLKAKLPLYTSHKLPWRARNRSQAATADIPMLAPISSTFSLRTMPVPPKRVLRCIIHLISSENRICGGTPPIRPLEHSLGHMLGHMPKPTFPSLGSSATKATSVRREAFSVSVRSQIRLCLYYIIYFISYITKPEPQLVARTPALITSVAATER